MQPREGGAFVAIVLASLLLVPSVVSGDELVPPPPRASLSPEEREAFVEQWLDVLARGTRDLNETPGAMDVAPELEFNLTMDVVHALRAYNETFAAQFDPAVAGPALGLSDPATPLVDRRTGLPLTDGDVELGYAALIDALAFHRVEFFARLESFTEDLAKPVVGPPEPPANASVADSMREKFDAMPLQQWGARMADALPPPLFAQPQPLDLVVPPPMPPPRNLTQALPGSPFLAAPESAWLDPSFRLPLSGLLDSLANQTNLTGSLAILQDVARAGHRAVRTTDATLSRFPRAVAALDNLTRVADALRSAVAPLPTPATLLTLAEGLPPEVEALLGEAARSADNATTYQAASGNRTYRGVWGAPMPVDLDGDGTPDLLVTLSLAPADPASPEDAASPRPRLLLERTDAQSPVPLERLPVPDAPRTRQPVNLTVAFHHPATGEVVAMEARFPGGLDLFEATLVRPDLALRFGASVGESPFSFRALVLGEGGNLSLSVAGPRVPQTFSVEGTATGRDATLSLDAVAPAAFNLSILREAGLRGTALGLQGDALPPTRVSLAGDALDVRTLQGASYAVDVRRDDPGAAPRVARLEASNAAGRVAATLTADRLEYECDRSGADVELLAGSLVDAKLVGGAWSAVEGAGRRFSVEPRGVSFQTDAAVGRVRAAWAAGPGIAVAGFPEEAGVLVTPGAVAFHALASRGVAIGLTGTDQYRIQVGAGSAAPFSVVVDGLDAKAAFRFGNLPNRTSVEVGADGLGVSATSRIGQFEAYRETRADPSMTIGTLTGVNGTASMRFGEGVLDVGLSNRVDEGTVLSSNDRDATGAFLFPAIPDDDPMAGANAALADVRGATRKYAAEIHGAVTEIPGVPANLLGSLLGPIGHVVLEFHVEGPLCQSVGSGGASFSLCFSNVPSRIALDLALTPEFSVAYNASEIIHQIRLDARIEKADLSAFLVLQDVPRAVELVVGQGAFTARTSTPLGSLILGGDFAAASLAEGLERLPTTLGFTWGPAGVVPFFGANESVGRLFLFVSTPGFALAVDLSDVPIFSMGWSDGSFGLAFPPGRRLGSAKVQMVLDVLGEPAMLLLAAERLPSLDVAWRADGGVVRTAEPLDLLTLQIDAGRHLSLLFSVTGVPSIDARWSAEGADVRLGGDARINELLLQFVAGPFLVYVRAEDAPAIAARRSPEGFTVGALDGSSSVGLVTLVIACGSGYYSPLHRQEDFVGLYLRPESPAYGLSVSLRGFHNVTWSDPTPTREGNLTVAFNRTRDLKVLVDLETSQVFFRMDAMLRDLPPGMSVEFGADDFTLTTTPEAGAGPVWLQAALELGTASGDAALPAPYWPYETPGQPKGIMGNTLLDARNGTLATKWKIYVPVPTALTFTKTVSEDAGADAVPSYELLTMGGSDDLGKVDLRTRVVLPMGRVFLDALAVATASNLPLGAFRVAQTMKAEGSPGNFGFDIRTGKPIDEVFVGLRFDGMFYPRGRASPSGNDFAVWASVRNIPESIGFTTGRSSDGDPFFRYHANDSTLDATVYIDLGAILRVVRDLRAQAPDGGSSLPGWLQFILDHELEGHILVGFEDMPAQGISIGLEDDGTFTIRVNDACDALVPACRKAPAIASLYFDFDFYIRGDGGEQGCIVCLGVLEIRYHWGYQWLLGVKRLQLLLEDLSHLRIDPGIETHIDLDGRLLFNFLAAAWGHFDVGISIHVVIGGDSYEVVCYCVTVPVTAEVQASYLTAQIVTASWSVNFFTIGYPCGLFVWCDHHFNAGVSYTYPGNWRIDTPVVHPPFHPFRGLYLDSAADGEGVQSYLLYVDPVTCASLGWPESCLGAPLVPHEFVMVYSFASHFTLDGPRFWVDSHEH